MDCKISNINSPLEQAEAIKTDKKRISIGLPLNSDCSERRFPLTPEGVKRLIEKGYVIKIENGAATSINYNDNAYLRQGAELTNHQETLSCDIVINLSMLPAKDIKQMRRGAMLLTLLYPNKLPIDSIIEMQQRSIVGIAVNHISDERNNLPFADILSEIDGRAAIATASSLLADADMGKGILLGGIAGINPCEVIVIGSGIAAIAASRSALGLGAIVKIFDDDVYSLRAALRDLGQGVIGSSLHERVLKTSLQTADVVVATTIQSKLTIEKEEVEQMKKGVVTFDLTNNPGKIFPSMPLVDLANVKIIEKSNDNKRKCYVNSGSAVPRTAAMALSNTFNTMLDSIITCDGLTNALKLTTGLRRGVFTFLGKITNPQVAKKVGCRFTDINIFLQLS